MTITTVVYASRAWRRARLGLGTAGVVAAFLTAPAALADSAQPAVPPTDNTVQLAAAEPSAVAGPTTASPVVAAVPAAVTQQPAEVPHLPSPDNLPPGTTTDAPPQGRLDYLRYVWISVRNQDVAPSNAWLLLAQRPMSANATPPAGVSTTPSGPVGSSAPAMTAVPSDTP